MTSSFRYAERTADCSVNLVLFHTLNGTARANVKGPVSYHVKDSRKIFEIITFLPLDKAFSSAIRMANRNDVEIVVSGDRTLWDTNWGRLSAGT